MEPVIKRLLDRGLLEGRALLDIPEEELAELLRGSGTYRRKARYLRGVWKHMTDSGWNGTPQSIRENTPALRDELLSIGGVGPETCDSILLYVLERPVFVVDAYTKRILSRHGFCHEKASYHTVQELFHNSLNPDADMFKEYHALLVACAKEYCRPSPRCRDCPVYEGEIC